MIITLAEISRRGSLVGKAHRAMFASKWGESAKVDSQFVDWSEKHHWPLREVIAARYGQAARDEFYAEAYARYQKLIEPVRKERARLDELKDKAWEEYRKAIKPVELAVEEKRRAYMEAMASAAVVALRGLWPEYRGRKEGERPIIRVGRLQTSVNFTSAWKKRMREKYGEEFEPDRAFFYELMGRWALASSFHLHNPEVVMRAWLGEAFARDFLETIGEATAPMEEEWRRAVEQGKEEDVLASRKHNDPVQRALDKNRADEERAGVQYREWLSREFNRAFPD